MLCCVRADRWFASRVLVLHSLHPLHPLRLLPVPADSDCPSSAILKHGQLRTLRTAQVGVIALKEQPKVTLMQSKREHVPRKHACRLCNGARLLLVSV